MTAVGAVTSFYLERANFNQLFGQDRLNVQFAKRKAVTAEARSNTVGVTSVPVGAIKEKNAATVALISDGQTACRDVQRCAMQRLRCEPAGWRLRAEMGSEHSHTRPVRAFRFRPLCPLARFVQR